MWPKKEGRASYLFARLVGDGGERPLLPAGVQGFLNKSNGKPALDAQSPIQSSPIKGSGF